MPLLICTLMGEPPGESLFGVEAVGDDVQRLERIKGGHVTRDVRDPDVRRIGPSNRMLFALAGAVDVEDIARDGLVARVRIFRRGEAWQVLEQFLVIPAVWTGRFCSSLVAIWDRPSARSDWSTVCRPTTFTVSVTSPTPSVTSTRATELSVTGTFSRSKG